MSVKLDTEQLDLFDLFKDYVDSSIHNLINDLFVSDSKEIIAYSDLYYYPVFTRDTFGKKVLKRIMIRNNQVSQQFLDVDLEKVESTGASWEELLDFLKNSPANHVNPVEIY